MPSDPVNSSDIEEMPGYHIRRLQQIAVAIFLQETERFGLTPVQYATLRAVNKTPGIDQRSLAGSIGLDTSTIAGVIDRMEARKMLLRSPSAHDRRVRLLNLTDEGRSLLEVMEPAVLSAQERMLEPLPEAERAQFMRMLQVLVSANNTLSRAPREG